MLTLPTLAFVALGFHQEPQPLKEKGPPPSIHVIVTKTRDRQDDALKLIKAKGDPFTLADWHCVDRAVYRIWLDESIMTPRPSTIAEVVKELVRDGQGYAGGISGLKPQTQALVRRAIKHPLVTQFRVKLGSSSDFSFVTYPIFLGNALIDGKTIPLSVGLLPDLEAADAEMEFLMDGKFKRPTEQELIEESRERAVMSMVYPPIGKGPEDNAIAEAFSAYARINQEREEGIEKVAKALIKTHIEAELANAIEWDGKTAIDIGRLPPAIATRFKIEFSQQVQARTGYNPQELDEAMKSAKFFPKNVSLQFMVGGKGVGGGRSWTGGPFAYLIR